MIHININIHVSININHILSTHITTYTYIYNIYICVHIVHSSYVCLFLQISIPPILTDFGTCPPCSRLITSSSFGTLDLTRLNWTFPTRKPKKNNGKNIISKFQIFIGRPFESHLLKEINGRLPSDTFGHSP